MAKEAFPFIAAQRTDCAQSQRDAWWWWRCAVHQHTPHQRMRYQINTDLYKLKYRRM